MIVITKGKQRMTCEDGSKILAIFMNYPDWEIEFDPANEDEKKLYKQMLFLKALLETQDLDSAKSAEPKRKKSKEAKHDKANQ